MTISGIFDLTPLVPTTFNDALRLTPDAASTLSLHDKPYRVPARLVLAVGGAETEEFRRQTREMADHWAALSPDVIEVPGRNHFDVLDGLVEENALLQSAVLDLLAEPVPAPQEP
jgi:arylformamidase